MRMDLARCKKRSKRMHSLLYHPATNIHDYRCGIGRIGGNEEVILMPGAAVAVHAWPWRKSFFWKRELSHTFGPSRILMRSLVTNNDRVVFCWRLMLVLMLGLWSSRTLLLLCCGLRAGKQGNHGGVILEHLTWHFKQDGPSLANVIIQSCLKQCLNCCSIIKKKTEALFSVQ